MIALSGVAFATSGCDSAKRAFGQSKTPPDEFVVYKRPPLTLPPEYGLRPPTPGSDRPHLISPRDEARSAILRRKPVRSQDQAMSTFSQGTRVFLERTGADKADPNIRVTVNKETSLYAIEDRRFVDKLIFWVDDAPHPGTIVDPKKEQKRIMENEALGKPITEGTVPEIKRKPNRKGLLNF